MEEKKDKVIITSCVYNCLKESCPRWVVLANRIKDGGGYDKDILMGRCADAWTPMVLIEIKELLEKLIGGE